MSSANNGNTQPLLEVKGLKTHFPIKGGVFGKTLAWLKAVDGVSFSMKRGESLGLVGESGCGKSTLGRTLLRLEEPTAGEVYFNGARIDEIPEKKLKPLRRQIQMIFQDPFGSLDPRMTVGAIVTEPFKIHKMGTAKERLSWAEDLIKKVGLKRADLKKFPHEFSGGQRQRIGIARAIALKPQLIVADEPVAALDVSIQAQVLNLLNSLKKEFNLTFLFVSHDLSVVKYFSDRIAVMYLGRIVELTDSVEIYKKPLHPYTRALMSAIPRPDPEHKSQREVLTGDVPTPIDPPSGCSFHPRCRFATDICRTQEPQLVEYGEPQSHLVSCHHTKKFMNSL